MSLFRCREVWSVSVGPNSDTYDGDSLLVDYFDGEPCVWLGCHDGYLRAYHPKAPVTSPDEGTTSSRPGEDLLYEMRCEAPVLQLARGHFSMSESGRELAVLHPTAVSIYSVVRANSENNPLSLTLTQHYSLTRPAFCLITGPFGQNRNRDFICVQSLDSLLTFIQQEGGSVEITLEKMLLPSRMAFLPRTDEFIYQDADMCIVSYQYQQLITKGKPNWTHNIGETVNDIQVVLGIEEEQTLVVLTERSLCTMAADGSICWVVRLQRAAMCQHSYLPTAAEKVMTLVCYDDGQLEVYSSCRLLWAAMIDVPAISVKLVHLAQQLPHLLFLTLQGQLECVYLGTQPWLYLMPSAPEPDIGDVAAAEQELQRLHTVIASSSVTSVAEDPLTVSLHVNGDVVTSTLTVVTPLTNVQVVVSVGGGLMVAGGCSRVVSSLVSTEKLSWQVMACGSGPVSSLVVHFFAIYTVPGSGARVQQCSGVLGWRIALEPCAPATAQESPAKLTLTTALPPVAPGAIFGTEPTAQAAGVTSKGGNPVTLLAGKTSRRYRIQADRMEDMSLVVGKLVDTPGVDITFPGPLPLPDAIALVTDLHRHLSKQRTLSMQLGQLTAQYRTLQKKVLGSVKDAQRSAETNLYRALDLTYASMGVCIDEMHKQGQLVADASCRLAAICRLIIALLPCMQISPRDRTTLVQVFSPFVSTGLQQGWLETTNAFLSLLLKTRLAKSAVDQNKTLQATLEPLTDQQLPKLIKLLTSCVDRATRGASLLERSEFDDHKESQQTVPSVKGWKDETAKSDAKSPLPKGTQMTRIQPSIAPQLRTSQPQSSANKARDIQLIEEDGRVSATKIPQETTAFPAAAASTGNIVSAATAPATIAVSQEQNSIWDLDIDDVII